MNKIPQILLLPFFFGIPSLLIAQNEPVPTILSAEMRSGTTIMDIVYQVDDPDDATVKVRALAFVDGVRSFNNVILPVTFVDGTETNLGDAIATGVEHTLSWNVGADWNIDLGELKFEILCRDERGLLPFEWITIPAAGTEPELTISKNSPTDTEVLDAFFWQYADGDPGLELVDGEIKSHYFSNLSLVSGSKPKNYAIPYILMLSNLTAGGLEAIRYAQDARAPIQDTSKWHSINKSWAGLGNLIDGWGVSSGVGTLTGLIDIVAIAAGWYHNLAIKDDGTVVAWGSNSKGESSPPKGLSNVTAIAAGLEFSLALKEDGTVVGWGDNSYGQASPPNGLSNVKAISAGPWHSLALHDDGTVTVWGGLDYKELAPPPVGLSNVIAISAGHYHNLALRDDGNVIAWKHYSDGSDYGVANAPYLSDVTAISAGYSYSLALRENGTVVGWGYDTYGKDTPPTGLSNVVAIEAAAQHSVALLADGTVVAWGMDTYGANSPPQGLANVTSISSGRYHTIVLIEAPTP